MMDAETKRKLIDTLDGRCSIEDGNICDKFEIDINELDEIMGEAGYERCCECGYWCLRSEMTEDGDTDYKCDQC
jgi:hypothetical protein